MPGFLSEAQQQFYAYTTDWRITEDTKTLQGILGIITGIKYGAISTNVHT
jgi:hypothetical protein